MASSSEAIPATQRGQSGQLTYQFWAANSRIPNTPNSRGLTTPFDSCTVTPPGSSAVTSRNREVRAMTWEAPAFVEVKMDAEINSYQPDNFDREPDDRF